MMASVFMINCAIHRKFPFICYKKECVLSQLGYYGARESFKRAKINASVRRHKRMVKRNIKAGRKGLKPPYDTNKESAKKDSLTYSGGFSGICKEMKIIFVTEKDSVVQQNDTLVVNYLFEERDLSEVEKKAIKILVEKNTSSHFKQILISNCHGRSVMSEYEIGWTEQRERKIIKYLKSLGINTTIIIITY